MRLQSRKTFVVSTLNGLGRVASAWARLMISHVYRVSLNWTSARFRQATDPPDRQKRLAAKS